jgi:GrpB-like predicted nucleotidyltransferase (UPF0157 family)
MSKIVVADYDPAWPDAFEAERARIRPAIGDAPVEHIGSTAVPGLPAKPIIDLMAAAPATCIPDLLGLGYERAEWGDFGERLFLRRCRPDGLATHHLSLTTVGSSYWDDHLAFRDALRGSRSLCERYATLKRQQAAAHDDIDAYTRAKTSLVREALLSVGHQPRAGWAAEEA